MATANSQSQNGPRSCRKNISASIKFSIDDARKELALIAKQTGKKTLDWIKYPDVDELLLEFWDKVPNIAILKQLAVLHPEHKWTNSSIRQRLYSLRESQTQG